MIKIHDKVWGVKHSNRPSEPDLAYMTYLDKEDKAFEKRQETGRSWARGYTYGRNKPNPTGEEFEHENEPLEGFEITDIATRWSTANKLVRVKDPRGFVVEIPSSNLVVLCQITTISDGIVREKCVWGRDAGNHVLLPVNSEPYKTGRKNIEVVRKSVSLTKIDKGDVVYLSTGDDTEYVYIGRVKLSWNIKFQQKRVKETRDGRWPNYNSYNIYKNENPDTDSVLLNGVYKDTRWCALFRSKEKKSYWSSDAPKYQYELKASGKAYKTGDKADTDYRKDSMSISVPYRVVSSDKTLKDAYSDRWDNGWYPTVRVVDVEFKDA